MNRHIMMPFFVRQYRPKLPTCVNWFVKMGTRRIKHDNANNMMDPTAYYSLSHDLWRVTSRYTREANACVCSKHVYIYLAICITRAIFWNTRRARCNDAPTSLSSIAWHRLYTCPISAWGMDWELACRVAIWVNWIWIDFLYSNSGVIK